MNEHLRNMYDDLEKINAGLAVLCEELEQLRQVSLAGPTEAIKILIGYENPAKTKIERKNEVAEHDCKAGAEHGCSVCPQKE